MPPLGKYLPHIAPADAMVIDFGKKNEMWCCEIAVPKLAFKARNRPSTQLIKATSCIEKSNTTIKAKELSYCTFDLNSLLGPWKSRILRSSKQHQKCKTR
jgi:hypothetical protein